MPCLQIFGGAGNIGGGYLWKPAEVHVVFEVGNLHLAAQGILRSTEDILFVRFALPTGDGQHRFHYLIGETLLAQMVGGDGCVLDGVVQECHDFGFGGTATGCHPEGVEDIVGSCLVALSGMCCAGYLQGFFVKGIRMHAH